jgi:hypothetical protein
VAGRGLPELDAMALRVGDPRESTVLVLVPLVGYVDPISPELFEERVEIVDAIVQHECWVARAEIRRLFIEE